MCPPSMISTVDAHSVHLLSLHNRPCPNSQGVAGTDRHNLHLWCAKRKTLHRNSIDRQTPSPALNPHDRTPARQTPASFPPIAYPAVKVLRRTIRRERHPVVGRRTARGPCGPPGGRLPRVWASSQTSGPGEGMIGNRCWPLPGGPHPRPPDDSRVESAFEEASRSRVASVHQTRNQGELTNEAHCCSVGRIGRGAPVCR